MRKVVKLEKFLSKLQKRFYDRLQLLRKSNRYRRRNSRQQKIMKTYLVI